MNISGSPSDRRDALAKAAASDEPIDIMVGDWMSELNMPSRAYTVTHDKGVGYEETFLEALEPALENLAKKRIKLAVNAGTVATNDLFKVVVDMVQEKGLDLTVAWVEGDLVLDAVQSMPKSDLVNICTGQSLEDWGFEPFFAQCYLGGMGIKKALDAGADIVLCGRVADASPIVAGAAWYHGWGVSDYEQLSQALMAGHLIECSTYVTGGNFTGFKSLDWSTIGNFGYPIAEIAVDGDIIITKAQGTGGLVSVETCKEQLLYEIQGLYYLNCDVTAAIDNIAFTQLGKDRVRMSGVRGLPPPPTTKVGLTAPGGYKSELHWAVVGLDIEEKAKMLELQVKASLGPKLDNFTHFSVQVYGTVPEDPQDQNAATLDMRLVAQSRDLDAFLPKNFGRPCLDMIMNTFPAATITMRMPSAIAVSFHFLPSLTNIRSTFSHLVFFLSNRAIQYQEYFPALIPQPNVIVHFSHPERNADIVIPPPSVTLDRPIQQLSYETQSPLPLTSFGKTVRAPLGHVVMGRAGDKGSNCNLGLFVRNEAEWPWLQSLMSTDKLKELMGKDYCGQKIERMEFPNMWAVHFLLHNHLDRGVSANSTLDSLGKFLCEYIRCKPVDVPIKFLENGRV